MWRVRQKLGTRLCFPKHHVTFLSATVYYGASLVDNFINASCYSVYKIILSSKLALELLS